MTAWIYCCTAPPVDAHGTQALLRSEAAIWSPPPGLWPWPGIPVPDETLYLVWQETPGEPILLLGCGTILAAPRPLYGTTVLWTGRDAPRMRAYAEELGYSGGPAMSFIRLAAPWLADDGALPEIVAMEPIANRLNIATEAQVREIRENAGGLGLSGG